LERNIIYLSKLMKGNINRLIGLTLMMLGNVCVVNANKSTQLSTSIQVNVNPSDNQRQEKNLLFSVKKEFNEEEYQKIKQEVDLIEEMEQKKLKEDSSQFGLGYGVEYGKDYIIYTIDSITGEEVYRETHRGSGAQDASDGIQPDARSYSKNQRAFKKRIATKRERNERQRVNRALKRKEQDEKDDARKENRRKNQSNVSISGGFFKILMLIIIAVILGYAAYMLFVNSPVKGKSHKILYDQDMNPEMVELSELEVKINNAKQDTDYRTAVRLYFIWVIKELSDRDYIVWKKRKTNYNYLLEVNNKEFRDDFESSIKNYEFIWYGKYALGKSDFEGVENHFKKLITIINTRG